MATNFKTKIPSLMSAQSSAFFSDPDYSDEPGASVLACDTASCSNEAHFRYTTIERAGTIFSADCAVNYCDDCWAYLCKRSALQAYCASCHGSLKQNKTEATSTCVGPIGIAGESLSDDPDHAAAVQRIYHRDCGTVCNSCCGFMLETPTAVNIVKGLEPGQIVCKRCITGDPDTVVRCFLRNNAAIIMDSTQHPGKKRLIRPISAGVRYPGTARGVAAVVKRAQQEKRYAEHEQAARKKIAI